MVYKKDFTTTYTINGHEYSITSPALFDSNTNELIPNNELDDKAAEKARQLYRKDMDLISPQDLKKYRAKLSLSQRNLAELTGFEPQHDCFIRSRCFPNCSK